MLILALIFSTAIISAEGVKTVAVVEFLNRIASTDRALTGLEGIAEERLVTVLTGMKGFRVVERERLAAVIAEQKLSISGLVDDSETAIQLGKLVGAEYIVTGSLNALTLIEKSFTGYGVVIREVDATFEVSMRMINVTTGIIELARIYRVKRILHDETRRSVDTRALSLEMLDEAVRLSVRDMNTVFDRVTEEQRKILVEFLSTPAGASVEVDGFYVGSTPMKLTLREGVHFVRITLGGYEPWEMRIRVSDEMNRIHANLGLHKEAGEDR